MPATTLRPLTGSGTVSGVPQLPHGFTDIFDSTLVHVGEVELHTVQGGAGQPLLGFYAESLARDPEALRAGFDYYRATDDNIAQNRRRKRDPLTLPVLSVAGAHGQGERLARSSPP
ncbi:hypothetical protein [Streptomyces platensis]|uniref:hypothetical protein n=1 Tax=Streptomyces platensis TaxID=58346 RepID=UPI00332F2C79